MSTKYVKAQMAGIGLLALTACGTPDTALSISAASIPEAKTDESVASPTPSASSPGANVSPTPQSTPSPSNSPTASPSPSPSPSPSASPTVYAYSGGHGTITSPYLVSTTTDFQNIEMNPAAYFSITQDISFEFAATVHPMSSFSGVLYGNNKILYRMKIAATGTDKAALFLTMSGTLVEVKLSQLTVTSQTYSASFAIQLSGMLSTCSVTGNITAPSDGNGFNTGVGNPVYYQKTSTGVVSNVTQSVNFNGNHVNYSFP